MLLNGMPLISSGIWSSRLPWIVIVCHRLPFDPADVPAVAERNLHAGHEDREVLERSSGRQLVEELAADARSSGSSSGCRRAGSGRRR